MNCRNLVLVIVFSSFLCLVIACAAKQPSHPEPNSGTIVLDADEGTPVPVPNKVPSPPTPAPPAPAPAPVSSIDVPEGLILITVRAETSLGYCFTDIGYKSIKNYADSDGLVRMVITPEDHQINCHDTKGNVAVDKGSARYPLWVNNTKLHFVEPEEGGMYYMYVCEDGRVLPTKP
jgi:hypothetical protein